MRGNVEEMTVTRAESGKTLQELLAARCGLSRRAAKAIIDGRSVWVNRKCVWIAHHPLHVGDLVETPRAVVSAAKRQRGSVRAAQGGAAAAGAPGELRHVRVLVETPHWIFADKPAGALACGDPKSVEAILRLQLKAPTLEVVHRLDRDTTGCLMLAKTHTAFLAAVEAFKTRSVSKTYAAICAGRFPHLHQTVEEPLDDKPAVTHVTRQTASPDASFLRVRIETGRTNQIRRHLASIRFPVLGDRTFGLKTARDPRLMQVPRQMLHAAEIELPDPMVKGGRLKAHSPLPADFRRCLKLFGL